MAYDAYTEDLSKFGMREIGLLRDLLDAWLNNGLPEDFWDEGVKPAFNMESGYVFLTNTEYQVCMEVDGKLESFYTTPYEGHEGFYEDLLDEVDESWDPEDIQYLQDLAESREDAEGIEKLNALMSSLTSGDAEIEESTRVKKTAVTAAMSDDPDSWKEVEQIIKAYEGAKKNPKTGWTGTVTIKRNDSKAKEWSNDNDGTAWLWDVICKGDAGSSSSTDLIIYYPATMDGGQKFVIYPKSGGITHAKNLAEFKKALRSEYSYLR